MAKDIIDINEVLERVEGDQELLVELIEIFLEDYPQKVESLKQAAKDNNAVLVSETAHSLKGASANISAKEVSSIFLDLEHRAKDNDLSGIEESLKTADSLVGSLKDYLSNLKGKVGNS